MTKAAERARERHQRSRRVEHRVPDPRDPAVREEITREVRDHPSEHGIERSLGAALADVKRWSEPPP
jgi:hypothetical protein